MRINLRDKLERRRWLVKEGTTFSKAKRVMTPINSQIILGEIQSMKFLVMKPSILLASLLDLQFLLPTLLRLLSLGAVIM